MGGPDLSPRGPASGGGLAASLFGGSGVQAGLQSVWRTLWLIAPYGHGGRMSAASLGVDFRIAEAVDSVQVIYRMMPKKLIKQNRTIEPTNSNLLYD